MLATVVKNDIFRFQNMSKKALRTKQKYQDLRQKMKAKKAKRRQRWYGRFLRKKIEKSKEHFTILTRICGYHVDCTQWPPKSYAAKWGDSS